MSARPKRVRPGDFDRRVRHDRKCIVVRPEDVAGLSEHDRAEVERAADFMRRTSLATDAGVPLVEAAVAIFPDVYPSRR